MSAPAYFSNGRRLAAGGSHSTIVACDETDRLLAWGWIAHEGPVNGLAFSPDSQITLCVGRKYTVKTGKMEANASLIATLSNNTVPWWTDNVALTIEYGDGTEHIQSGPNTSLPLKPRSKPGGSPQPHDKRLRRSFLPGVDLGFWSPPADPVVELPPFAVASVPTYRQARIPPMGHFLSKWDLQAGEMRAVFG